MSVMKRICALTESVWHEVAQRAADPQHEADELLKSQRKQLEVAERLYEQTLQQAIDLRQQQGRAGEVAAKRAEQAELAMKAGEETLARLALQEKLLAEASGEQCRAQYAQCQDALLALAQELRELRAGYAEACGQRGLGNAQPGAQRPQQHMQCAAHDTLRELGIAGREIGRDVSEALRQAGRLSREALEEAGGFLQRELKEARSKFQRGSQ